MIDTLLNCPVRQYKMTYGNWRTFGGSQDDDHFNGNSPTDLLSSPSLRWAYLVTTN